MKKMKYQIELWDKSGNHSCDIKRAASIADCFRAFYSWAEEVSRYADPQNAYALIFHIDCDYPEFKYAIGPRGGIVRERT